MKRTIIAGILFLMLAALAAQPAAEAPAASSVIRNVNVGTTAVIEKAEQGEYNFDMLASGVSEIPLVRVDGEGTFHPLVASFSTTDSVTWTYTVVEGLTWSDGVPVTASDILFTLQYEDAEGSANLIDQTDSKGAVTPSKYVSYALSEDGKSISLTLREANVRELSNMTTLRIVPEHLYADGDVSASDKRITCGPYQLSSFDKASGTIVFSQNPHYPASMNVECITYHLFGSDDTMYMALQNGDLDFTFVYNAGTPATYLEVLSGGKNISVLSSSAANAPLVLAFNNSSSVFADENLRKAVASALDYETIAKYVGGSSAGVANKGFVPESTIGYKGTEKLSQNLADAASFMTAAGYGKNAKGVYEKDGKELSVSVTYRLDKSGQVAGAELLKNQLEAFGILVSLDGLDSASYNAKTSNKFSNNNVSFEMALFGYTAAGMGMGSGLGSIYVDKNHGVQGGCQVEDPIFQEALKALSSAKTIEEYYEGASLMQDFYSEHLPLVALYWDNMNYAVSSSFTGYAVDGTYGINNVETWANLK